MIKKLLLLFGISMVPVVELRGAIPYGVAMDIPFWLNYTVCVLGNIVLVPFLVMFSDRVLRICVKIPKIGFIFQKIIDRGNKKITKIGRYELLSVFLFVAVPLPGTGAWTGSLISALLQLNVWKATAAISLGVMTAGIIMGIVSFGLFGIFGI